jgi:glycopeptide antibiotics resistance protein
MITFLQVALVLRKSYTIHKQKVLTALKAVRRKPLLHQAVVAIFIVYSFFMVYLLFFGFSRDHRAGRMYNLVPFKTIANYIVSFHHFNFDIWVINLFGNVAAFVPFGFLAPLLFARLWSAVRVISLFFMLLLAVETIQFITQVGSFDVDDIILNMVGVMIGTAFHAAVRSKSNVRAVPGKGNNKVV